ncbi:MAG: NAD(P)/FAD-dependent oxidoreductase [Polyangia bacterium]
MSTPHIVILGGGFGGLYCARALREAPFDITLVDRKNHHLFQPLLYQVATAALDASDIAAPLRQIFAAQKNVRVILGEAVSIDTARQRVILEDAELAYDGLVIATGVTHTYFGHPEYEKVAPGLKTLDDALEIRRRVFSAFEEAERTADPAEQARLMTFVLVGGGPTGVELAGALAEIARETLPGEFRHIDPTVARVLLVEAHPSLLTSYPEELRDSAAAQLRGLGVELKLGARVTDVNERGVTVDGTLIPSATVLWAAGVAASPVVKSLGVPLDRSGRVIVEPDLSVPGHPNVFVIGDLAAMVSDDKPVPGVAQGAMQGGERAADNLRRVFNGERTVPFHYWDKGSLATIGRARAVADLGKIKLGGPLAWLIWAGIHILFLIGFRNRVSVGLSWAWAWLTRGRQARLITGRTPQLHGAAKQTVAAPETAKQAVATTG